MKNAYLPEVIKKLKRRKNKLIEVTTLKEIIKSVMNDDYLDKRAYKIIYYLKKKGRLISLKKSIFFVKDPDTIISEESLIENHYWSLLHQHCTYVAGKLWYVSGLKALQIGFMDYSIPESIHIVTDTSQRQEVVVSEKTIQFKKYTAKKQSLFGSFKKFTSRQKVGGARFLVANKELAVLEILYSFDEFSHQYELEYLKKALKKYKHRDVTIREHILKLGKHHTSANRLYSLLLTQQPKIAPQLMEAIKKYGFVIDV